MTPIARHVGASPSMSLEAYAQSGRWQGPKTLWLPCEVAVALPKNRLGTATYGFAANASEFADCCAVRRFIPSSVDEEEPEPAFRVPGCSMQFLQC